MVVAIASENEHPDLFWALRGGGGNFGVVTSFEFRLHSVGPNILAGPILWDAGDAGDVLRFYRDFIRDAPDELGTVVRFGTAPPLPVIPENLRWRPVLMVGTCYAGPIEEGEQRLGPLRAFQTPLLDLIAPAPYDIAWTRKFFAALGRFRKGVYVNFLGADEDPARVREAYGDSIYDRLVDVKTMYDPDNVFHHNQNIRPKLSDDARS